MKNSEIKIIFTNYVSRLITLFEERYYIRLTRDAIIVHQ
ncbi:hypothetical protein PCC7424_3853 [Gloeothece citriformis PCC 7424]|uniref:Uncharacterized protein n=1 Tax=Gloeothece citriformis (strain PCC 7424) TaxID=65393 RepID=B7KJE9_GLOC7|nr:hypothetical protein PCC7424_3853 [Gloeothece citriformis PCC 7424]